jgi:histidinol-phosphate/aromatic aminotransferase/cobyric acid decarboxylase-like protein
MQDFNEHEGTERRPKHGGAVWALAAASGQPISAYVPADVNDAPYPPAPAVLDALKDALAFIQWAPEAWADGLRDALALHHRIAAEHLVVDAGASPIIERLLATLVSPASEVIILAPTYSEYGAIARRNGAIPVVAPLTPKSAFSIDPRALRSLVGPRTSVIVVGNPNNPTGTCLSRHDMLSLLEDLPSTVSVVVDEVYVDYSPEISVLTDVHDHERLCVVRSFSKGFALAGLRVGYATLGRAIREAWDRRGELPWRVGLLADLAARTALEHSDYMRARIEEARAACSQLRLALADQVGCITYPTKTHFFLLQPPRPGPRQGWLDRIAHTGVAIRSIQLEDANEDCPFFRVTTRTVRENARIVDALNAWRL